MIAFVLFENIKLILLAITKQCPSRICLSISLSWPLHLPYFHLSTFTLLVAFHKRTISRSLSTELMQPRSYNLSSHLFYEDPFTIIIVFTIKSYRQLLLSYQGQKKCSSLLVIFT